MLFHCSKPSRWQQPPRVTRNLQPQLSPSATRCNHSSKCTRKHSQSHYDDELMIEMSGRYLFRLTRMLRMSKCQEKWAQAGQGPFIDPLKQIQSLCPSLGCLRDDRTRSVAVSDHCWNTTCRFQKQIVIGAQQLSLLTLSVNNQTRC
jgi:hypothetical protein